MADYTNAFDSGNHSGFEGFDSAQPAPEYQPIPPGIYVGRVLKGEACTTKTGLDAYRLRFEITEGLQIGKTVMRLFTFGPKSLPYTKRDLAPFGLTTAAKLLSPFPEPGQIIRVRLIVAIQTGDDGAARNDVKKIEILEIKNHPAGAFAIKPTNTTEGGQA